MSGIVGSRLNIRGSGIVGKLGTDGQVLTSSGAGASAVFEASGGGAVSAINNATANELVTIGSTTTELDSETNLTYNGTILGCGADGANADLGVGLHIKTQDANLGSVEANADNLIIEQNAHSGITIISGANDTGNIYFGDSGDGDIGKITYNHSTNALTTTVNTATAMTIDSSGAVTTPLNPSFRAYQSTNTDYANGHTVFSSNITENFDTNSDFSNGTFTAPVTGIYLFQMSIYDHNASDDTLYDMGLTTSNRGHRWGDRGRFKEGYTGVTSMKVVGSIIADMDANDTAYIYSGNSVTFTNNANVEHAYFSGVLIG